MNDAAADVDVEGEDGIGGELAERLEGGVKGIGCFWIERQVYRLVGVILFSWSHGCPNQGPPTWMSIFGL